MSGPSGCCLRALATSFFLPLLAVARQLSNWPPPHHSSTSSKHYNTATLALPKWPPCLQDATMMLRELPQGGLDFVVHSGGVASSDVVALQDLCTFHAGFRCFPHAFQKAHRSLALVLLSFGSAQLEIPLVKSILDAWLPTRAIRDCSLPCRAIAAAIYHDLTSLFMYMLTFVLRSC